MAKLLVAVIGGVVLLVVLFFALVILRKSVPYVLRSDLNQLASSAPYNNEQLATEICGTPVDFLGAVDGPRPYISLPTATMLPRWQLIYPSEGTAFVRVIGVGVSRPDWRVPSSDYKPITGRCEATITFKYRCVWAWNGVATVLEKQFLEGPTVVPGSVRRESGSQSDKSP